MATRRTVEAVMEDELLTTEQLAGRYKVDPGTIRRWRHEGRIPPGTRFGRRVLTRASALDDWEKRVEREQAAARRSA
jgi:excisionase family DNA binding protein